MKNLIKIYLVVVIFIICPLTLLISCKKKPTLPVVTTLNVSAITQTTASSGGNVTDDGGADVTMRGICWATSQNPTTGSSKTSDASGTGSFTSYMTGLTPGTTYYVRAYAINSVGTSYGNEVSFSSGPILVATITTADASLISKTSAVTGGNITSDGGGIVTGRGVCWNTSQNPTTADSKTTDGSGDGIYSSNLTNLNPNTTYYIRAYAINSAGVAYGTQKSFQTLSAIGSIIFNPNLTYGSVSDIDGNTYKTIQIGTQTWMAENLKTTKYNDNTNIPLVADNSAWENLYTTKSPGCCWYLNDPSTYKDFYGAYYNWYAVNTGKICPTGWHVPSETEWTALSTFLGGTDVAGGKLKETGTTHWQDPNVGATNETGFTALPVNLRNYDGAFYDTGVYGNWWSDTYEFNEHSWTSGVYYNTSGLYITSNVNPLGLNVRCLKD
jgi:uncharacterized protein (TIGR02145 family)